MKVSGVSADLLVHSALAAGALVAGYIALNKIRAPGAGILDAVNPASDNNLAYRGINVIVQGLTGDEKQTAGGAVFDLFNPRAGLAENEYAPAAGLIVTVPEYFASDTFTSNEGGAAVGRTLKR